LTPPLRQGADREALRAALADGTIDALGSDHNPVAEDMKNLPFGEAEPGATGLELLLSLALRWGRDAALPLARTLACVTSAPVRVLGDAIGSLASSAGRLVEGGVADLCLVDPHDDWAVTPERLVSQGKHTPFSFAGTGMAMTGRVRMTLVAGTLAHPAAPALGAGAGAAR
ncbi:MAG: amidohydrolase family protein, partial [Rubrivivax sp.]|nr:amidohydrolase family protein [Rubrivivax sp.]